MTYRGVEDEGVHPSKVRIEAIVATASFDATIAVTGCGTLTMNIAGGKMHLPHVSCILAVRTGTIEEAVL